MGLAIVALMIIFLIIVIGAKLVDKNWHTYGDILGNDKDNTDKLDKLEDL